MSLIQRITRHIPKSSTLINACMTYLEKFQKTDYENNCNPQTNGEYSLLNLISKNLVTVFDVGANVGDWSAYIASITHGIRYLHIFEPNQAAYQKLQDRFNLEFIMIHRVALSSTVGKASLFVFGEASGLNSLHNRDGLQDGWGIEPTQNIEEVELETIDSFCQKNGILHVDLIKIDTEGHEVNVILGAKGILQQGGIDFIQFEYGGTYIDARKLLKDVFEIFNGLDYTIFLINPDRLIPYPRYDQRLENFQYKNFIIIRNQVFNTSKILKKYAQLVD
ncbi:MAG: FkbM family methyltransferase [Bacteroidota bacterium]